MPAEKTIEAPPMTAAHHRMTFFRQSGWMMIATVVSGLFAAAVHVSSKVVSKEEYSAFATLLQLLNWMMIPGLGLQMVFAQQTSAAMTETQRRELVGTTKAVMRGTFWIWLAMVAVVLLAQGPIVDALRLSNPAALWLTLVAALGMIWQPLFLGLLQGRQNFLWMGWVAIFNGFGRVFIGAAIVGFMHGLAAGLMAGVVIGLVWSVGTAIWQNCDLLKAAGTAFDRRGWLKRVLPLTFGAGAFYFIFSADAMVVQHYLGTDGKAAPYDFGGTLARAIVLSTSPLAAVMFPKLVHLKANAQKGGQSLLGLTLLGTAILGGVAATGLTVVSPWLIKLGSKPENVSIVPLMPLFAWAMVPLAMGNVLLNNLMAHSRFKVVPVLVLVAAGYWVALQYHHDSFKTVIETMGIFTTLFFLACAVFTWLQRGGDTEPAADAGSAND